MKIINCKIWWGNDFIASFLTFMQKNPFKNRWKAEIQRFLTVKNSSKRINIANFVAQSKNILIEQKMQQKKSKGASF